MKKLISVIILSIVLISCAQAKKAKEEAVFKEIVELNADKKQYVWGSSDIPLIDEFELMEDPTNFDTISGTISISSYRGYMEEDEIKEYYTSTLPQLGWELIFDTEDNVSYKRNSDRLEISLKRNGREAQIKFLLSSM